MPTCPHGLLTVSLHSEGSGGGFPLVPHHTHTHAHTRVLLNCWGDGNTEHLQRGKLLLAVTMEISTSPSTSLSSDTDTHTHTHTRRPGSPRLTFPPSGPNRKFTFRTPAWCFSASSENLTGNPADVEVNSGSQLQTKVARKSGHVCFIQKLTLSMLICRHTHFKQHMTFQKTSSDLHHT